MIVEIAIATAVAAAGTAALLRRRAKTVEARIEAAITPPVAVSLSNGARVVVAHWLDNATWTGATAAILRELRDALSVKEFAIHRNDEGATVWALPLEHVAPPAATGHRHADERAIREHNHSEAKRRLEWLDASATFALSPAAVALAREGLRDHVAPAAIGPYLAELMERFG